HPARHHRAERREHLDDALRVHGGRVAERQCASADSPDAGVRATDSPPPHPGGWVGLLDTKPAGSLSTRKSISGPSRKSTALGSIRSLPPLSSTTSSCGATLSAYSIV